MDEHERRSIIVAYITNNPGCNKQKVVKALEPRLSRVPVLNTIEELMQEDVIRRETEKENSREHKLYVNTDNILVSVANELKEFEKSFFSLIDKAKQEFDNHYLSIKSRASSQNEQCEFESILPLLSQPIYMFQEVVNVFLIRAVMTWPLKTQDKDILKKLFTIVFTKIADIQMRLLDIYRSSKAGDMNLVFQSPIVFNRMYATDKMIEHFEMFGKLGMQKEIECVLDSVWKIYTDYKLYAFPEPHLYSWSNFDYTKDDWRKLIALQKQYPDQTYRNYFNLIHGVSKG